MTLIAPQIVGPKDRYCFIHEHRGLEYKDREFVVVQYGTSETTIRDPKTSEKLTFYNAHLYTTFDQRKRSYRHRIDTAQAIGRSIRKKK